MQHGIGKRESSSGGSAQFEAQLALAGWQWVFHRERKDWRGRGEGGDGCLGGGEGGEGRVDRGEREARIEPTKR
ncbi:hypothetical protein CVT25_006734 [Psilocybe cyanescens]|uniref:Uncharacterized protein n=1 Tax=Psilocybe cyanescens TaxID=93625 RepID=A0A409XE22_PSICY|nr:hypothetical protein CVT25_006734 [Psilocybe cyanescens]